MAMRFHARLLNAVAATQVDMVFSPGETELFNIPATN